MVNKIFRLLVILLSPFGSYSQSTNILHIGDTIPAITFTHIFNNPGASISSGDYRGKLIILDFWDRYCGTCIEAFPKMEKLQKDFGDKIKILLVTKDKNEEVRELFERAKWIKVPDLTMITDDSVLNSIFPHTTVPHHVWVNPDGRVQFITDFYNANEKNISKVLNGQDFNLHEKKDVTGFERDSSLLKEGKGRLQKYITGYSFAMQKIEESGSGLAGFTKDTVNKTLGFKIENLTLVELYKIAFGGSVNTASSPFYYNNRILYRLPDRGARFKYPSDSDSIPGWQNDNVVCYESQWKMENVSLAYQYLQEDVNRFFPYAVSLENVEMPCYSLSNINNKAITKGEMKTLEYLNDTTYLMKNMPVSVFVESLNILEIFKAYPVIDDTRLSKNIDLLLTNAFSSIAELNKQLLKYGLVLKRMKKNIKMLVIGKK